MHWICPKSELDTITQIEYILIDLLEQALELLQFMGCEEKQH